MPRAGRVTARRLALALACALAAGSAFAGIYQWTDAQGRVHFGDRRPEAAPETATALSLAARPAAQRLTVQFTAHDDDLTPEGRARVEAGVARVFEAYTRLFALEIRRPVTVDIHLFRDAPGLAGWVTRIDPTLRLPPTTLGLYLTQHNLVGAWRHSDDEHDVIATLLHESSHVILAQLSPYAPAWLHEGLAQYFEGLQPGDATAADGIVVVPRADASAAIDRFVANGRLVTLRDYFSLDEQRWRHLAHVEGNPVPYSVAWSVTWFLMSRPVGRQILTSLLQDLEKSQRAPTTQVIDRRYPGGYAMMEYDWFKSAQQPKTAQRLRW